jgi:protein-S-isoprenylcysteine O-methyltransferase Ste14
MLAASYSWLFTLLAYGGIGLRIAKEERFMLNNFPEYQ